MRTTSTPSLMTSSFHPQIDVLAGISLTPLRLIPFYSTSFQNRIHCRSIACLNIFRYPIFSFYSALPYHLCPSSVLQDHLIDNFSAPDAPPSPKMAIGRVEILIDHQTGAAMAFHSSPQIRKSFWAFISQNQAKFKEVSRMDRYGCPWSRSNP